MKKTVLQIVSFIALLLLLHSCNNYGTEKVVNGTQLFYTSEISESLADSIGKFLVDNKFADGQTKTVQITKNEKTYEFRMVIKKGIDQDPEYIENTKIFGAFMSAQLFNNANVDIHLCDENLETIRVIPMADISDLTNSDGDNFTPYTCDLYNISYPKDWEFSEKDGMFVIVAPKDEDADRFQENINFIFEDATPGITLKEYAKKSAEQIKAVMNNVTVIKNEETKLAGLPCHKSVFTATQGEFNLYFEQYYWILEGKALILTVTIESSKAELYPIITNSILKTFTIKQ